MEAIIPDNLTNDFLRDEEIEENAFAKPWTEVYPSFAVLYWFVHKVVFLPH